MEQPTVTDDVRTSSTLFERCAHQQTSAKRERPCISAEQALLIVFVILQVHRIFKCKAQGRWREA